VSLCETSVFILGVSKTKTFTAGEHFLKERRKSRIARIRKPLARRKLTAKPAMFASSGELHRIEPDGLVLGANPP
jgi:hypothetical protein